ncbi:MAG: recombinase family protein [Verrucomicrobiales bacterium]|nr:recombinase family protein [Planctomycetota bacterium]MCP5524366.1 recombinase family protein [Verrucomicrobiales bacterium]
MHDGRPRRSPTSERASGKGQVGNNGYPRQRETIRRYCKSNRLEAVEEFGDEAVSGCEGLDRAGLTDLFVAPRANGVRTVVVGSAMIAAQLNHDEIPSRDGGKRHPTQISRVLKRLEGRQ